MSKSMIRNTVEAMHYSKYVEQFIACDAIPRPPETPAEFLVITEEFPHLLAAYCPQLADKDSPTARALAALMAEIPDWN